MYYPKNILVTGGSGFIGSNFILYMMAKYSDIRIFNLDKLSYAANLKNLKNIEENKNYFFYKGDICNRNLVARVIRDNNIETIVNFAAESHVDRSISNSIDFINTNIIGTHCLLEEATSLWSSLDLDENSCRFHHISTDEVYGSLKKNDSPFSEENKYFPNSPYSATKASSDHLVRAWSETYKLPISISNCSNNFGKFQYNEKFIPTIIHACKNGTTIPVYGDGKNVRDWIHVDDHCSAIDIIIRNGKVNNVYNVGGNNEKTNIEIVNIVCNLCDQIIPKDFKHKELVKYVIDRKGHDYRYAVNSNKILKDLDWSPNIEFYAGLSETIEWYLDFDY